MATGPRTLPAASVPVIEQTAMDPPPAVELPLPPSVIETHVVHGEVPRLTVEQIESIIQRQPLDAFAAMSKYAETLAKPTMGTASHPKLQSVARGLTALMTALKLVHDEMRNDILETVKTLP